MSSRKPTFGQRLRYAFDNTMSRGTPALVGWLAVATLGLIVVFSVVTLLFDLAPETGDGTRPGVVRQLFNTLLHAMDAGAMARDTGSWRFLAVMLLLTLGGIFIFSALIGVIATGLDNQIQRLRKGRSFVIERDHTLILGWSETIFTVVRELVVANSNEKNPVIVILADRDKVETEDAIRDKVDRRPVEDYVRPGEETTFREVVERARHRGETAIGYRTRSLHDNPDEDYGVRVNPVRSTRLRVEQGDRVIVFAEG